MSGTILLLVVVVVLVAVLKELPFPRRDRKTATGHLYGAKSFFSPAEADFYRCLIQAYGSAAIICPKVRLLDLVEPLSTDRSANQTAFNKVSSKHVDFVILRPDDLSVVGVIELDDRSHRRTARAERDSFVDDALKQASIPVCRIKALASYELNVLCGQINAAFGVA